MQANFLIGHDSIIFTSCFWNAICFIKISQESARLPGAKCIVTLWETDLKATSVLCYNLQDLSLLVVCHYFFLLSVSLVNSNGRLLNFEGLTALKDLPEMIKLQLFERKCVYLRRCWWISQRSKGSDFDRDTSSIISNFQPPRARASMVDFWSSN